MLTIVAGPLIGGFLWYASQESNASSPPSRTWLPPTSNITVGAYYYPWHSDDFHRGQGYLREQLATVQKPSLGEYDDSDPATIAQHLAWSRQANIRLWVTSWWGEGSREDITTKEVILNHPDLKNHKIALFYETTGRIKQSEEFSTHRVVPDIEYLCEKYFDHPNYFRIDGRPVLFIYLTRKLAAIGNLDTVIDLMKQTARNKGHDVFVVGDQVFGRAPNIFADEVYTPFETLDAATNYDVYGSMGALGGYAGEDAVKENYQKMLKWREIAHRHQCAFIPAASPGYNDLGVRPEKKHSPLSRQLTADDKPGSLFKAALREARNLVDAKVDNLLMVNSFNEWHEDTQIEPASGGSTTKPDDLTYGLEYHGYGELYLNILREQTKD
jgi:glycoprotein endo-alpha-1,2-mannosidase